ncbi:MAG: hypothetical protein IPH57_05560 [Saprospiraceae bacterium]|nr:hypothetical protein [Saprospiraceae bacterium]
MNNLSENIYHYKKQAENGLIQAGYKALIQYILDLRIYFKKKYPEYYVSGNFYYGYMDMTFFSFSPGFLKSKNLKVMIVFIHKTFRFEAWLAGQNKQVQTRYWYSFRRNVPINCRIPTSLTGVDSILEYTLSETPDFNDLKSLTLQIEDGTKKFIKDIEDLLSLN